MFVRWLIRNNLCQHIALDLQVERVLRVDVLCASRTQNQPSSHLFKPPLNVTVHSLGEEPAGVARNPFPTGDVNGDL